MKSKNIILFSLGLLLLVITVLTYLHRVAEAVFYYGNTDFYKFYQTVRFYFAGQNIYDTTIVKLTMPSSHTMWRSANGNLNPPFFSILLLPLYYLSYAQALMVWVSFSMACTIASIWLVLRAFPEWCKTRWQPMLMTAAFLIYMPNSVDFAYGQIAGFLSILLIGLWLAMREHRDILAGILLGILVSVKVFFGLFFVFFLIFERWRLVGSAIITSILCAIAGWLVFGLQAYAKYHQTMAKIGWYAASWNVSFWGFFLRIFAGFEGNVPIINKPYLAYSFTIASCLILIMFLLWVWHKLKVNTDPNFTEDYINCGFSISLIAMLLLSPLGWIYYFPLLLIPYLNLVKLCRRLNNGLIIHLLGCVCIMISTLMGGLLKTGEVVTAKDIFFNSGYGFYALLLFLGLYIYAARSLIYRRFVTSTQHLNISENLYLLIYALTFIPSILSFIAVSKNVWIK